MTTASSTIGQPRRDVFICHASEDKDVARPLALALLARGLSVWLDEQEIRIGDRLLARIDEGLLSSRFGAVVLSPSFFAKDWPRRELDGLTMRELEAGDVVVLPIWHQVDREDVLRYSPLLAGTHAARMTDGLIRVADQIEARVRADASYAWLSNLPVVLNKLESTEVDLEYFQTHGKAHIERVKRVLLEKLLPALSPALSPLETSILIRAAELHDIGMATQGAALSQAQAATIRDQHARMSREFVLKHYQALGIADHPTAAIIARLCLSHRRQDYVRTHFGHASEGLQHEPVRVQLLSALLKLSDALDITYAQTSEVGTAFYRSLPSEDKWRWNACRHIQGVHLDSTAGVVTLSADLPDDDGRELALDLVNRLAIELFTELFLVLPFTLTSSLPWCMVELETGRAEEESSVWQAWWIDFLNGSDIEFEDIREIASQVRVRLGPLVRYDDCVYVLEHLTDSGYAIPAKSTRRLRPPPADVVYPVNSARSKDGFLSALQGAEHEIELFGTDGLTFPDEVLAILGTKLRQDHPIRMTLFFVSPAVLLELEGDALDWDHSRAEAKIRECREKWAAWAAQQAAEREDIAGRLEIVFVSDSRLANLHGSLLVDKRILRLNIHRPGEPAVHGMIINAPDAINLVPLVTDAAISMRATGESWIPWP